jgi:hypothetical protein
MERSGAFSAVTGGRALSFHHLSMGETAAPLAGNAEGAKLPCREVVRKDQPGSLGTEEKASVLSGYWPPHANTFERYVRIKTELFFPEEVSSEILHKVNIKRF